MNYEHGNNMDNNLNFSTSTITNPLSSGASAATTAVDDGLSTPMNGKEFAGLMRDLLNKSGRQEIAAPVENSTSEVVAAEVSASNALGLQTVTLGEQFAVITTSSPLPDANSLAAFARAQGLGEGAVKTLFGDLLSSSAADSTNGLKISTAVSGGLSENVFTATGFGWPVSPSSVTPMSTLTAPVEASIGTVSSQSSRPQNLMNEGLPLFPTTATLSWLSAHPGALPISSQVATSAWSLAPHLTEELATPA